MRYGSSKAVLSPAKIVHDLAGRVFGRLTVVLFLGADRKARRKWRCLCACNGEPRDVWEQALLKGVTLSCGCLHREIVAANSFKHGHAVHGAAVSPEYSSWRSLRDRCENPNNKRFADYGGRGIALCDRWRNSFLEFLADMGPRPPGTSIDRKDNDRGYEPGNCRWATRKEQQRNRRCSTLLTFRGETLSIPDWADRLGIALAALAARVRRGWTPERALTQPIQEKRR